MYKLIKLLLLLTPFLLVSCLDIVEEIDLNNDKSGKATYTFNLSQSKVKLSAALKLDSIAGHKIPKLYGIEREISKAVDELKGKEGIVEASYTIDESDYIYVLTVRFKSLNLLNKAIQSMSYWERSNWKSTKDFYDDNKNIITKKGEKIIIPKNRKAELDKQKDNLVLGKYVFILRSSGDLEVLSPSELKLSGNKKAVMFKSNLYDLINNEEEINLKILTK